jgi:hypothetical protein
MSIVFRGAVGVAALLLTAAPAAARDQAAGQVPVPGPAQVEAQAAQVEPQTQAQTPPPAPPVGRLRVFLDCFDCFSSFLRDEIDWVDFVRDNRDADVTLLSSSRTTGGGGREITLRFFGLGEFADHDHELRVVTLPGDTENLRRVAVLQTVVVGLLDYVAHTGIPDFLDVRVASEAAAQAQAEPVEDPWNLWVFSVRGNGDFESEESRSEQGWNVNLTADRVTEEWVVGLGARVNRNTRTFDLDDGEELEVVRRDGNASWFLGKSLGPHWTFGVDGRVSSSSFGNTRLSLETAPAIEFNVFPYREYATRQLRIQYEAGVQYVEYDQVTIFGKIEETLWRHELSANLDQRQTWGTLRAGADFGQYLHDTARYRVAVNGNVNVQLTRGLSVNFNANASRIRDQISLPLENASPEEVLLRLRELQSGFEVRYSFGITYRFGSIFNNIVNPRFGRGGGGGFGGGGGGGGR